MELETETELETNTDTGIDRLSPGQRGGAGTNEHSNIGIYIHTYIYTHRHTERGAERQRQGYTLRGRATKA